jgi:hypothetical protein
MKTGFFSSVVLALALAGLQGQGLFFASNGPAQTRLYSIDGPLAGTNIYAQMLAGAQPGALSPVGPVDFHINGIVSAGRVAVPDVPPYAYAYVQMVAWDSLLWGPSLLDVPADQLGRTDIVTVFLTTGVWPEGTFGPRFTQPAIVPIPEPPVGALFLLAGLGVWLIRFVRPHPAQPT